jgi:hypothetical protein
VCSEAELGNRLVALKAQARNKKPRMHLRANESEETSSKKINTGVVFASYKLFLFTTLIQRRETVGR